MDQQLWRALKHERVYLQACETGSLARAGFRKWVDFYNLKRPNSGLGGKQPAVIYWQAINQYQPDQQVQRAA